MTKKEITRVFNKAEEGFIEEYLDNTECDGIGFWKEKRPVTLKGAVAFVRWQALQLNGEWNSEMLQEALVLLQKKAILIDTIKAKELLKG